VAKSKLLRLDSTQKFKGYEEEEEFYIEGYGSCPTLDRDVEIVPVDAIDTKEFEKNPIILYGHDRSEVIGRAVKIEKRTEGLWLKVLISKTATKVRTLIEESCLSSFSIGFQIKDYDFLKTGELVYKDINMLECSVVPIPANPDAIFAMVKSFNKDSLTKDNDNNPTQPTKESTEMDEKLVEMKKELEAIKAEKARMDAEKADREAKEKEAKDAAEKAELVDTIKTLTEAIEVSNTKIKASEESIIEAKKELEEKIEEVAKAAPKVTTVPVADKDMTEVVEAYKGVLISQQLFGIDKMEETKAFEALPERMKAVTLDSQFTTRVHADLLRDIKNEASIYPLFREIPSEVTTDVLPFGPELTTSWGSSASDQAFVPKKVSIDYNSCMSRLDWNYIVDEEDIIKWLPFVKQSIVEAIASEVDAQILDYASAPTNTYRGLASWALGASLTYDVADEKDLVVGDIDGMRAVLGKYGVKPQDTILVLNSAKYLQLVDDDMVTTVDKFGPTATIHTGELAKVRGISILVNDNAVGSSTAGAAEYAATMFNRNFFAVKMKSFMVEFDKTITSQTQQMVASVRAGFAPLFPLTASEITNNIVVVGKNPTS